MTKTIILGIAVAAVLITGVIAFMPALADDPDTSEERDNTTVTGLTTPATTATVVGAVVLLDNAGFGGTSDVEVTWTGPFTDPDCRLVTLGGTPSATPGAGPIGAILGNDGAFAGTTVAHNDVAGTDAILLVDKDATSDGCSLGSDFITISTVGSEDEDDD